MHTEPFLDYPIVICSTKEQALVFQRTLGLCYSSVSICAAEKATLLQSRNACNSKHHHTCTIIQNTL